MFHFHHIDGDAVAGRIMRAIADQITVDLHDLETRLSGASRARELSPEAVGYGRGVEEHVDLIVSVCEIASLAEYRREEPRYRSRLPVGADYDDVIARLDRIRGILLPLASSAPSYLRGRRYHRNFATALAVLFLSLDAIPAGDTYLTRSILAFAPISQRTQDPQGDAQAWAEAADASE